MSNGLIKQENRKYGCKRCDERLGGLNLLSHSSKVPHNAPETMSHSPKAGCSIDTITPMLLIILETHCTTNAMHKGEKPTLSNQVRGRISPGSFFASLDESA